MFAQWDNATVVVVDNDDRILKLPNRTHTHTICICNEIQMSDYFFFLSFSFFQSKRMSRGSSLLRERHWKCTYKICKTVNFSKTSFDTYIHIQNETNRKRERMFHFSSLKKEQTNEKKIKICLEIYSLKFFFVLSKKRKDLISFLFLSYW